MKLLTLITLSTLASFSSAQAIGFVNTDINQDPSAAVWEITTEGKPELLYPSVSPIFNDITNEFETSQGFEPTSVINAPATPTNIPIPIAPSATENPAIGSRVEDTIIASITSSATGFVSSAVSVFSSAESDVSSISTGLSSTVESIKSEASDKISSAISKATSAVVSVSSQASSKTSSIAASFTDNAAVGNKAGVLGAVVGVVVAMAL